MPTISLLYKDSYPINDQISISIPTVEQILDDEDNYYSAVTICTAMPIDLMVQLDDMGIDFSEIDEYSLFILLFRQLQTMDTKLIFGNLDLTKFAMGVQDDTHDIALVNAEDDIIINRRVHAQIATTLRKIHHLEKDRRKPGNKEARDYMLERARKKLARSRNRKSVSQLESLIVAMVNTEQFKYDFCGVKNLSIYQFNESVRQIIKKIEYHNRMIGVYTGSIRSQDLNPDDLNWLIHK